MTDLAFRLSEAEELTEIDKLVEAAQSINPIPNQLFF